MWDGGVRIVGFLGGPAVYSRRGTTFYGLGHTVDLLPTMLAAAGLQVPQNKDPTPMDGVSLWEAVMSNTSSPRTEVVHQILNKYNHRDCNGSDHALQNCGAAIRVGKYKLLAGYPGDSRWVPLPNETHNQPGQMMANDGCDLSTGENCPCFRGYCLFNIEADPNERNDLSHAMPDVVKQLIARLAEVSQTGTQGSHLCTDAASADAAALGEELKKTKAYLPYVELGSDALAGAPWKNDMTAPSCYNP